MELDKICQVCHRMKAEKLVRVSNGRRRWKCRPCIERRMPDVDRIKRVWKEKQ